MTMQEDEVDRNPRNDSPHRHILTLLRRRYDMGVMNNVYRADYVEVLVSVTLGTEWRLTWMQEWDWAAWDCQHKSGARLEVKQSAARQSWDREKISKERNPRFDIAPPLRLLYRGWKSMGRVFRASSGSLRFRVAWREKQGIRRSPRYQPMAILRRGRAGSTREPKEHWFARP